MGAGRQAWSLCSVSTLSSPLGLFAFPVCCRSAWCRRWPFCKELGAAHPPLSSHLIFYLMSSSGGHRGSVPSPAKWPHTAGSLGHQVLVARAHSQGLPRPLSVVSSGCLWLSAKAVCTFGPSWSLLRRVLVVLD